MFIPIPARKRHKVQPPPKGGDHRWWKVMLMFICDYSGQQCYVKGASSTVFSTLK